MTKKTREVLELAKNLLAHHANGGDWEAMQSQRVIDQINECLTMPERNVRIADLDALELACERVLDAESLKAVIIEKRKIKEGANDEQ